MISDVEVDLVMESIPLEYKEILEDSTGIQELAKNLVQSCDSVETAVFVLKDYLSLHRTYKAFYGNAHN